jgi:uncharacterized membrane protein YhhN
MPTIPYKNFTLFFLFLAVAHFISLAILPQYVAVTKPLIMAGLTGFYISTEQRQNHVFLLALIFAMLGDIFLLFEDEMFFIIGLVSFLLMQWCYVFVFKADLQKPDTSKRAVITVLFALSALILFFVWPDLGEMKLPVSFYVFSILTMVSFSIVRNQHIKGYRQVAAGALLFMVSDTLLAFNKFAVPIPFAPYLIMSTYMAAQYFIVTGIVLGKSPGN